jgi:ribonuclease HIII
MPSIKLPKEYLQKAVELLLKKGFQKRDVQNAYASFTDGKAYITLYPSGSVLLQGDYPESVFWWVATRQARGMFLVPWWSAVP